LSDKAATYGLIWRRFDEEPSQNQQLKEEAPPKMELGEKISKKGNKMSAKRDPRLPTSSPLTHSSMRTIRSLKKTLRVSKKRISALQTKSRR
jgi:hypothetical protein